MVLSNKLVDEFVSATFDGKKTKTNNSYYGTAVINGEGSFVRLDGSDIDTPAIFTVKAHDGDRVLVILQNRKVIVTGNITSPSIILGVLEANDYILVRGYLTTNENRTSYNDDRATGLTFSSEGIGAKGNTSKWYMTADGHLYANDVDITGKVTAGSGKIGDFTIGSMLYYGSKNSFNSSAAGIFFGKDGIALGENSPFKVTAAGGLTATTATIAGDITATSGYLGSKTNGFTIDEWGIFSGAKGESSNGYITLTTKDFSRTINNEALSGLRFAIGSKFAVDASGKLHAADGIFSGTIKSSSGNIGDFTIGNGLYTNSKSGMNHANGGVYIGSDGIALGIPGTFSVTSEGKLSATGASISGAITATSLTLGQGVKIDYEDISDAPDLTVYVKKNGTIGTLPSDGATSSDTTGFKVSTAGALIASNAIIYGTVYASSGKFTGDIVANSLRLGDDVQIGYDKISGRPDLTVYIEKDGTLGVLPAGEEDSANKTGFKVSSQGLLTASNAVIYGTVYAKAGRFTGDIVANSLTLGTGASVSGLNYSSINGTPNLDDVVRDADLSNTLEFYVSQDGTIGQLPPSETTTATTAYTGFLVSKTGLLTAANAVIFGKIYASEGEFTGKIIAGSGEIGGFAIDTTSIHTNGVAVTSGAVNSVALSSVNFTRTIDGTERNGLRFAIADKFAVDNSGILYASSVNIKGAITATSLSLGDGVKIGYSSISNTPDLSVYISKNGQIGTFPSGMPTPTGTTGFKVSTSGLLQAANAVIYGTIYASAGEIGGFAIDSTSIHTSGVAITSTDTSSIGFASADFSRSIGGRSLDVLRLAIADSFGVTKKGTLFAKQANFAKSVTLYDEDFSSYSDYETVSLEFARQNAILPPHRSTDPTPSGAIIYGLKSSSGLIAKEIYSSTVIRASGAISTLSGISAGGSIESLSDISADGNIDAGGNINARGTVISVGSTGTVTEPDTTYRRVRIFNASGEGSFRISATGAMGIYSETQSEWLIYTKPETVGNWAYIPMTLSVTSSIISNGVIRSRDSSGDSVKGFTCQNTKGYYSMNVDASGNFVIYDQANSKAIMTFYPSTAKLWDDGYIEINRVLMVAGPNPDSKGPRMVASCLYTNGQRINYFATGGNSSTASHQTWLNVNGQFNGSTTYDTISYASASSDIRLKTNVTNTEVSDALNLIKKIKIRSFDWKDMGHEGRILDHQKIGFIADELEELDSKLAAGGGYDEDGGMIIKSVDTFYLLGYVVKALQELDNRITVLQKGA